MLFDKYVNRYVEKNGLLSSDIGAIAIKGWNELPEESRNVAINAFCELLEIQKESEGAITATMAKETLHDMIAVLVYLAYNS